jgi:hypothetical protein
MGQPPTHPELLDWLASELGSSRWSLKHVHRLIVTSAAYRTSSRIADPVAESRDPQNLLLRRSPVRRLEAEALRDALLATAGTLAPTMHGPGVPPHLTPFMDGRGRPAASGPLDGAGRRTLYLQVRRNFLNPLLLAFDFPAPASCMGRRNVSNVPAQPLSLLGDPFVLDQARHWAERIHADAATPPDARLAAMFESALARMPTNAEADALHALLDDSGGPGQVDAWAAVAHALFNAREFLFLP